MNLKTIGLIGGMSWESTVTYYKIINETVKEKLGGLHSAKCILYSVDFQKKSAGGVKLDEPAIDLAVAVASREIGRASCRERV